MSSKLDHYKNIGRIVRHPPSCVADAWRIRRKRSNKSFFVILSPPYLLADEESHTLNFETEVSTFLKLLRPTLSF